MLYYISFRCPTQLFDICIPYEVITTKKSRTDVYWTYLLVFFMVSILTGIKLQFIVVLISISQMANDLEHLFVYLLDCPITLQRNVYSGPYRFFNWVTWIFPVTRMRSFILCILTPCHRYALQILFYHSLSGLFTWFMISFAVGTLFLTS